MMAATTTVLRTILHYVTLGTLGFLGSGAAGCALGCDLATCDSGLSVRARPTPSVPYRVELLVQGTNTRYVWRCDAPICSNAFFKDYLRPAATVEVVVGADTTRGEFTGIRYNKTQPNGAKCDPTCYSGEVIVPLES